MLTSLGGRSFGILMFAGLAVAAVTPALAGGQNTKFFSFVSEAE